MTIKDAMVILEKNNIPIFESNRKGFDYFIPYGGDEIPISEEENESIQAFGTHLSNLDVIEFSKTL